MLAGRERPAGATLAGGWAPPPGLAHSGSATWICRGNQFEFRNQVVEVGTSGRVRVGWGYAAGRAGTPDD
jgi:hypothetical protein